MKVIYINKTTYKPKGLDLKWSIWNDLISIDGQRSVIFNTLSLSSVLVHNEIFEKEILELPNETITTLLSAGIIVDEHIDEKHSFIESFIAGKKDLSYIDLTILLTHNCQFDCKYCFEGEKKTININQSVIKNILSYLQTIRDKCKKLRVTWFGGEPLLAYKTLKTMSYELIDFCERNHIEYSADITTNGYAFTRERCVELVNNLKVKRYIITIDGLADIHDKRRHLRNGLPTFNRIWSNVHDLVNEGAWVVLRMTIDKENYPYIHDFLDYLAASQLAKRIGLSFCRTIDYNFTPKDVQSTLYTEQEFREIEWDCISYAHKLGLWKYSFPHPAPSGGCLRDGDIVISAEGDIFKCLDTVGDERWKTGDINGLSSKCAGINEEWYQQWLNWMPDNNEECANCVLLPLCSGGCPHNSLFRNKMHGSESQCPDWRANYQRQIIEIAKIL